MMIYKYRFTYCILLYCFESWRWKWWHVFSIHCTTSRCRYDTSKTGFLRTRLSVSVGRFVGWLQVLLVAWTRLLTTTRSRTAVTLTKLLTHDAESLNSVMNVHIGLQYWCLCRSWDHCEQSRLSTASVNSYSLCCLQVNRTTTIYHFICAASLSWVAITAGVASSCTCSSLASWHLHHIGRTQVVPEMCRQLQCVQIHVCLIVTWSCYIFVSLFMLLTFNYM